MTNKYLDKMTQLEDEFLYSLCYLNERQAESLLRTSNTSYRRLNERLSLPSNRPEESSLHELDSISSCINVWENSGNGCDFEKCKKALDELKKEMTKTRLIGDYIHERNLYMHKVAESYKIRTSALTSMEKLDYYFNAQITEFNRWFSIRSQTESSVMSIFGNILNSTAPNGATTHSLNELGSDINVRDLTETWQSMENSAKAQGKNLTELIKVENIFENIPKAGKYKQDLYRAKDNLNQMRNSMVAGVDTSGAKDDLYRVCQDSICKRDCKGPDSHNKLWRPNPYKVKRLRDCLVYSGNLQVSQRNYKFPTCGMLSFNISAKFSPELRFGLGVSGIVSVGSSNTEMLGSRIRPALNGAILRSFIDYKVYKRIYIQVNFEENIRKPISSISSVTLDETGSETDITSSFLCGVKLRTNGTNRFQRTLEFMYDINHRSNGQSAFVCRVGFDLDRK